MQAAPRSYTIQGKRVQILSVTQRAARKQPAPQWLVVLQQLLLSSPPSRKSMGWNIRHDWHFNPLYKEKASVMSFSSTPLFVHVKLSVYSMILIFASRVILPQWFGVYLSIPTVLWNEESLMFNIHLDFKREELQKPECSYSLGPFLF